MKPRESVGNVLHCTPGFVSFAPCTAFFHYQHTLTLTKSQTPCQEQTNNTPQHPRTEYHHPGPSANPPLAPQNTSIFHKTRPSHYPPPQTTPATPFTSLHLLNPIHFAQSSLTDNNIPPWNPSFSFPLPLTRTPFFSSLPGASTSLNHESGKTGQSSGWAARRQRWHSFRDSRGWQVEWREHIQGRDLGALLGHKGMPWVGFQRQWEQK